MTALTKPALTEPALTEPAVTEPDPIVRGRAGGKRRRARLVVIGFAILLAGVASLAGVAVYFALYRSISLDILRPRIEAAIRPSLPENAHVTIGQASIAWRRGQGFLVRASDVRLTLPGEANVAAAAISTLATPAKLLRGHIELRSLDVVGLDIVAVPSAPAVVLASDADSVRRIAEKFSRIVLTADARMRRAGLTEVNVAGAALRFNEAAGGPALLRLLDGTWMPLGGGRSKAWLRMQAASGGPFDLTIGRERGRIGSAVVSVELEGVPTGAIAPALDDADGAAFATDVTVQARIVTGREGSFSAMRGTISTGSGRVSFTGNDRINLAGASLDFAVPSSGNRIDIPGGDFRTGGGSLSFKGMAELGDIGEPITVVARFGRGMLPAPRPDIPQTDITGGGILARVDVSRLQVDVERFDLATPKGGVSAIGQGSIAGNAPGLSFALSLSAMPVETLRALWPPFLASKTRRWADENVISGTVGPATLEVALPIEYIGEAGRDRILPDHAVIGTLPFRDAVFSPISTFPKIENAEGDITFANATATVTARGGRVTIPDAGELDAAGTVMVIPELGQPRPEGDLHLALAGSTKALALLSNTPPLSIAASRKIEPTDLSGTMTLALDAEVPLFGGSVKDTDANFRLALTNFASKSPIEGRTISGADLVLEGSSDSYTVKGRARLDGIEATVDMISGGPSAGKTAVVLTLDEKAREKLGLTFAGLVTGPLQASIGQTSDAARTVALDLKDTRVSLPFLGWEKGAGVPATARFTMEERTDGTIDVRDLVVSGKGFGAKGGVTIGTNGKIADLHLEDVALRSGDNIALTAKSENGGYDVSVRGAAFDARGIIRQVKAGLGGGDGLPEIYRISLDIGSVTGLNDVLLVGVKGKLTLVGGNLEAASMKGSTRRGQGFEWTLGQEAGRQTLRIFAENGSALIRFLGIYERVIGGSLILDYSGTPVGGSGTVLMRNFELRDERALAPAVRSVREVPARMQMTLPPQSDRLSFEELRVPFRQAGWVINIDEASLRGAVLGATASGTINIPGGKMALSGTFIPAFGLNNIAGSIPILGAILGGGRNEGLLGITYKLYGPLDEPQLTMNPISAIAPGIFRKIFEYQ